MKGLKLFLPIILIFIGIQLKAQISIGTKASVLYSSAAINGIHNDLLEKTFQDAYSVSLFTTIPITEEFSVQPELSYNQKGFEFGQGIDLNLFDLNVPVGVSAITEVEYVQIPILGRVEFKNTKGGVYFLAGPSVAFATQAKLRTKVNSFIDFNISETDLNLSNDNYNRVELAAVLGTGAFINIGKAKTFLELRYHHGLFNVLNDPILDIEIKNRAFDIGLGFQLDL